MSDDDERTNLTVIWVTAAVLGGWIICCCITTKGCRDCSYGDRTYAEGAWSDEARAAAYRDGDRRLALQLHAEELQQQGMLTEEQVAAARAELERKSEVRKSYVLRKLLTEEYGGLKATNEHLKDDEQNQCTICLNEFKNDDVVSAATSKNCRHLFHRNCVADWLVRRTGCPICRLTFLQEDVKTGASESKVASVEEHAAGVLEVPFAGDDDSPSTNGTLDAELGTGTRTQREEEGSNQPEERPVDNEES